MSVRIHERLFARLIGGHVALSRSMDMLPVIVLFISIIVDGIAADELFDTEVSIMFIMSPAADWDP